MVKIPPSGRDDTRTWKDFSRWSGCKSKSSCHPEPACPAGRWNEGSLPRSKVWIRAWLRFLTSSPWSGWHIGLIILKKQFQSCQGSWNDHEYAVRFFRDQFHQHHSKKCTNHDQGQHQKIKDESFLINSFPNQYVKGNLENVDDEKEPGTSTNKIIFIRKTVNYFLENFVNSS